MAFLNNRKITDNSFFNRAPPLFWTLEFFGQVDFEMIVAEILVRTIINFVRNIVTRCKLLARVHVRNG